MSFSHFKELVEQNAKKPVKIKINNNRSTMLSVRWDPDATTVSMHKLFLEAPRNIMDELACYVRKETGQIPQTVRAFIDTKFQGYDYSHELDLSKLHSQGSYYNLKQIYNSLNEEYFQSKLDLYITWFGKVSSKARSRLTFGLYHDHLRLIKINKLLDSPSFPDYVVSYVVYHEMVHHVCRSYYDEKGIHRVHSKEFKAKEKEYQYFDLAQSWIEQHSDHLFHIHRG